MYNRKIAPTVSKIKKEIEDTIKISKSTLTLTLLDLGYKYKKFDDNRRLFRLITQRSKSSRVFFLSFGLLDSGGLLSFTTLYTEL
jgi:hypothetical protein